MNSKAVLSKRILTVLVTVVLLSSLIGIGQAGLAETQSTEPPQDKGDDFTHSVVLELFVTTWCPYCPSAEAVAKQLNSEYANNFVFITMVCDVNDKADERYNDYGAIAYPDGVFDGNYRREVGGQSDTSTYEGHIEDSGNRDVPDIDLSVEVEDNGDGNMSISYSATYQDMFPFFDAHLRVYIVERASRYPDVDGHAIPYGFIDYAFDEDVRLTAQVETSDSATWQYDDFENATFDNFVIIATLFDKSTGVEGYAVASATTEVTNIMINDILWTPDDPSNRDDMTITANVSGDVAEVELEYSICTSGACGVPVTEAMEVAEGTIFSLKIGDFGRDAESVHFRVIGRDAGGNEVKSEMIDVIFGEGSGDDDEGFFSEDGTIAVSGLLVIVLAIVLMGLYLRNRDANQELMELQDRLSELEGEDRDGGPDGEREEGEVSEEEIDPKEPLEEIEA